MAVARNVIANTIGTAVLAVATAATTILAFRLAGSEQFGLIGFYFTLHGIVAILDTGIGPGIVREVAHARSGQHACGLGSILFTFQGIYAGITGLTAIALIAASPFIATMWLTARTISPGEIQNALILAALIIATQRQRTVYSVFLEGMEQQVLINILQSGAAVVRALAVLAAMILIAPTAIVFLGAFLTVCLAELLLTAFYAWRASAGSGKPQFSLILVRWLWRFLLTSSVAVAAGALLLSADKLVVSAMLPLDVVGRYMFISQMCLIVVKLVAPNVTAIFPRLSASLRRGDKAEAKRVYFAAAQTLNSPEDDQLGQALGQAAQGRTSQEDDQRDLEHNLAAVEIAELPIDRRDNGLGEQVSGDHPGDVAQAAEVADDGRKRGGDDRLVQRCHQQHQHQPGEDDLDAGLSPRLSGGSDHRTHGRETPKPNAPLTRRSYDRVRERRRVSRPRPSVGRRSGQRRREARRS